MSPKLFEPDINITEEDTNVTLYSSAVILPLIFTEPVICKSFVVYQNPAPDTNNESPEEPLEPEVPLVPEEPELPLVPEVPSEPEVPEEPLVPELPLEPEVPFVPEVPLIPEVPEEPACPDVPDVPLVPPPHPINKASLVILDVTVSL